MFDKVVFAGGGHQCWWQAGFWEQVSGQIELHPRVIGAVSAGAATACLLYGSDTRRVLAWYERELKGVRSNINWLNLVRPGQRLMPHAAIYRKALRALLGGDNFRQLMWRAPEIRVQYARLPAGMSPRRAGLSSLVASGVDNWRQSLQSTAGARLGFIREVKRVQDCRSERELVDLLVAASCMPPFAPVELVDGEPCLDGEVMDRIPTDLVADVPGQTLVLMTRRFNSLAPVFARDGRVYVQPSEKLAVSGWDYTSAARFQKTYDLGRRDGEQFLKTFALGQHADTGLRGVAAAAAGEPSAKESGAGESADVRGAGGAVAPGSVEAGGAASAVGDAADDDVAAVHALGASGPASRSDAGGDAAATRASKGRGDVLDVSAKLADYREPTEAGIAEDLSASQPAESDGQERSGRSLRASNI